MQNSTPHPSHEAIAGRACEIYLKGGSMRGQCEQNWRQAEKELRENAQVLAAEQEMQNEGGPVPQTPVAGTPAAPSTS
ncbi:MAG: DUF2934 domain-containing protein [Candidatus Sumerlaeia bacterium]|nr:DUF2934 domain-containing protein [Candidatus Sumerlaeia bacterium]